MIEFGNIVSSLIDKKIREINTIDVAIVKAIAEDGRTATVTLKRKIRGNVVDLLDVPVAYQKFNECFVYVPIREGSVVLIAFSQRQLSTMLKNREVNPSNDRMFFSMSNAIIIGGAFTTDIPFGHGDEGYGYTKDDMVIRHHSGSALVFKADKTVQLFCDFLDVKDIP